MQGQAENQRICNQYEALEPQHAGSRRKTLIVVILTAVTMVLEIVFGYLTGSLALLTDGIHMGTHTFALLITLIAYVITDRHRNNPKFAFSSGKISVLGGYTNAILLGLTALLMVKEAVERLLNPVSIDFTEAIIVAVLGLAVNLVSAFILGGSHGHEHGEHGVGRGHEHAHSNGQGHTDHNLKAAYVHVITDALTSILAILALVFGSVFSLTWPDAAVALIGAAVILKWAFSLLRSTGEILVDYYPQSDETAMVQAVVQHSGATLLDFHLWNISEGHKAAQITVSGLDTTAAAGLKQELRTRLDLDHVTVELSL